MSPLQKSQSAPEIETDSARRLTTKSIKLIHAAHAKATQAIEQHIAPGYEAGPPTHPDMRRVSWGQSSQTTLRSELCIIAIGQPLALQSAQQHRSEGAY